MKKYLFLVFALLMLSARLPAQDSVTATLSAAGSTCAVTNACLVLPIKANVGGVTFTSSANASSNTLQFEATADGTTWVALNATPSNSTTAATSTTSAGTWQANPAGYIQVRIRMSTLVSGTATVTISTSTASARVGGGGVGPSGAGTGGSVSTVYTFYPSTTSNCALANYSPTATNYCALNNVTGAVDFSGTDAAAVVNSALAAKSSVGGQFYFKNGIYNLNSATAETNAGCSSGLAAPVYYSIGLPANSNSLATNVQFRFIGESAPVWLGEYGTSAIQTNGVILNVTSAAVTAAGTGFLAAVWQRPTNVGSSCQLTFANFNNEDSFENLWTRFPTNTRGNEGGIVAWSANTISYKNVGSDFDVSYASIASGSAPVQGTVGSFGLTGTYSGSGNVQKFDNTYVTGYYLGYDFSSEHTDVTDASAIYCVYPGEFGRVAGNSTYHPSVLTTFHDQENENGLLFGPGLVQGDRVDIWGLDIELGTANWYARTQGLMSESNSGRTSGIITYTVNTQVSGVTEIPPTALFSSGGGNFLKYESTVSANSVAPAMPTQINFSSIYNNATSWGGAWVVANTVACSWTVSGGIAANASVLTPCVAKNTTQAATADEFSKVTVAGVTSTGGVGPLIRVTTAAATQTYYEYACSGASGFAPREILKLVAGTSNVIASKAGTTCTAGDVLELDAIGQSPTTLIAYYNGAVDMIYQDSSTPLLSGYPGMTVFFLTSTNGVSAWAGGQLPTKTGTQSIYGVPGVFPTLILNATVLANTAPTIAAAGCGGSAASITSQNGTAAFKVNVGTSNAGSCAVTMPAAATDWVCSATDITTISTTVSQTRVVPTSGSLTTSITLANYTDISGAADWVDSDVLEVHCHGE